MTVLLVPDFDKLLETALTWKKVRGTSPTWQAKVEGEVCTLVMGDFPDEPLYTVTYKGQSLDLDDAPGSWTIER